MKKILILLILSITLPFQTSFAAELYVPVSEVTSRVNAERKAAGLPTLSSNALLTRAAEERARELMSNGYLEHVSPQGRSFEEWVNDTGYTYSIVGENLASSVHAASAEIIVGMWMGSPSHKANILSDKYAETGIGVVSGQFQGGPAVIAVQIFASPRGAQAQQVRAPVQQAAVKSAPIPVVASIQPSSTSAPFPAVTPSEVRPLQTKVVVKQAQQPAAKPKPAVQGTTTEVTTGVSVFASTSTSETSEPAVVVERFASAAAEPEKSNLWTTFVHKVIQLIHELF